MVSEEQGSALEPLPPTPNFPLSLPPSRLHPLKVSGLLILPVASAAGALEKGVGPGFWRRLAGRGQGSRFPAALPPGLPKRAPCTPGRVGEGC